MENYEKKYKELVGKIEKAYLYAQTDSTKAVLESLYPELAESEDERIRKELLESFKYQQRESRNDKEWLNGIKLSEGVAWLEKQENSPILSSSSNIGKDLQVDGFDAELNALLKKYEHLSKKELQEPLEFYLGVVRDDLDIVREAKPKWSDEDEGLVQHCCGAVAAADYYTLEDKEEMENWLKSIKKRIEEL